MKFQNFGKKISTKQINSKFINFWYFYKGHNFFG